MSQRGITFEAGNQDLFQNFQTAPKKIMKSHGKATAVRGLSFSLSKSHPRTKSPIPFQFCRSLDIFPPGEIVGFYCTRQPPLKCHFWGSLAFIPKVSPARNPFLQPWWNSGFTFWDFTGFYSVFTRTLYLFTYNTSEHSCRVPTQGYP